MTPGRNDPCPCGSGRKYKRCCLRNERRTDRADATFGRHGLPSPTPDRIPGTVMEGVTEWQVDAVPVPTRFEDDPEARPVCVVVMAADIVLHCELLARLGGEAEDVAAALQEGILTAAERVGRLPDDVDVRHPEVAAALSERLERRGVEVWCEPELADIEAFGHGMLLEDFDFGAWPPLSSPATWAAWGHPDEAIAGLFEAAAAFYRAAPWRHLPDPGRLDVEIDEVSIWTAAVLGAADVEFGLALYENPEDLEAAASPFGWPGSGPDGMSIPATLEDRVLSLTFDPPEEIHRPTRKEISRKGWEVAAPSAYPTLLVLNTPGGGLPAQDLADLTAALRAVAEVAEHIEEESELPEDGRWETKSGVHIWMRGEVAPSPWDAPTSLAPGDAVGPGADPEGALHPDPDPEALLAESDPILDRFARHLDREKGFGSATVEKHASNADIFCEYLATWEAVPLGAVHERDLRYFLFDWYIRKVMDSEVRARSMPVSLERFFRFLAEEGEIDCPWAEVVLSEREAYELRRESFPGGFWWDEGVGLWSWSLWRDLERRVMLPDDTIGDTGMSWDDPARAGQGSLHQELRRRWLLWRDEEIRAGTTEPEALRHAVTARQRAWESRPHPDHEGLSPLEVVERERRSGSRP